MENRPKSFEPHICKDAYKVVAYIITHVDLPIISRLHSVKRISDKVVIEKGKTVLIEGERYRILRFLDFQNDLGIECRSTTNKKIVKEIGCIDCNPENIEI